MAKAGVPAWPFGYQSVSDDQLDAESVNRLALGHTWSGRDGMLCMTFPAALLGREDCGFVYRNPKGSPDAQNEYVRVALGQVYYFSVGR